MLIHPNFDPQSQANKQKIDTIIDSAEAFSLPSKILEPLYVFDNVGRSINSVTPDIILQGSVDVLDPCKLDIGITITSTWNYVCNVSVYIDDVPINLPPAPGAAHPDATFTYFHTAISGTSFINVHSMVAITDVLPVGIHTVKIGFNGYWSGNAHTVLYNQVTNAAIVGTSNLTVKEFR